MLSPTDYFRASGVRVGLQLNIIYGVLATSAEAPPSKSQLHLAPLAGDTGRMVVGLESGPSNPVCHARELNSARTGRDLPVNNVEWKALAEPTGAAERRSTPHYWALNISRFMLSST